jgi:hypothetical protein
MTVYFIECAGRIKIGYAKDVRERLKGLSTGAAHELTLVCALDGSVHFERAIHARLKHLRQRGEWFEDCTEVRELIESLRAGGPQAIGFSEPPTIPKDTRSRREPFESPLRPVLLRMEACAERYVGTQIAAALKQEQELGLDRGTLVNARIDGHYTSERARVAFVMIRDTAEALDRLTSIIFKNVIDPDGDPLDQALLILPATKCVERLERGLAALFAPPDLTALDMSGYAEAA